MNTIRILFLGASKRVSLLERFVEAANRQNINLELFSCEADHRFCPVSTLATVISGPSFLSAEFVPWLHRTVQRHAIDIVLPNMDAATVALSQFAEAGESNCRPVVSASSLCKSMYDKMLADVFFRELGIPVPPDTPQLYPKILKPRLGFGSHGIQIVTTAAQQVSLMKERTDYFVQDFIAGCAETTVDIYISPKHGLMGYVLRDRIEVSDGEVMVCQTRPPHNNERELIKRIASIPGWQGCITFQYLAAPDGNLYAVEINPRFGGGSTCAIEAGLDMASYILLDHLERPLPQPKPFRNLIMSRARRDFFHEY